MPNRVPNPEPTPKLAMSRTMRGTSRRALELVSPLTGQERDAKRGEFHRIASLHFGAADRDPTAHALRAIVAGHRQYMKTLLRYFAEGESPEKRTAALELLAEFGY